MGPAPRAGPPRERRVKAGRPKNFTWQVKDKALPFTVNLSFRKANVEKSEIASALRELLRRIESE